jgi:hypothetical protein
MSPIFQTTHDNILSIAFNKDSSGNPIDPAIKAMSLNMEGTYQDVPAGPLIQEFHVDMEGTGPVRPLFIHMPVTGVAPQIELRGNTYLTNHAGSQMLNVLGETSQIQAIAPFTANMVNNGDFALSIAATTAIGNVGVSALLIDVGVNNGTAGGGGVNGLSITPRNNATSNLPDRLIAISTGTSNNAASGALASQGEWQTGPSVIGGVTTTTLNQILIRDVFVNGGSSVGTQYGLRINSLTGASTNWAVYTEGTTASQFGGTVGFATTLRFTTTYSAAGTPLPTCNTGAKGTKAVVSDATIPTYLGTYTSGGAVIAPVFCDGTNWLTD